MKRRAAMRRRAQEEDVVDDIDDAEEEEEAKAEARRRAYRRACKAYARYKRAQDDEEIDEAVDEIEGRGDAAEEEEAKAEARRRARRMAKLRMAAKRKAATRRRAQEDELEITPEEVEERLDEIEDKDESVEARRRAAKARALRKARRAMRRKAEVSDDLVGPDADIDMPRGELSEDLVEGKADDMVQQTESELPDSINEAEDKVLAAYRLIDAQIAKKVIPANVNKSALASKYARRFTAAQMKLTADNLSKVGSANKQSSKGVRVSKRSSMPYTKAAGKTSSMDDSCLFF